MADENEQLIQQMNELRQAMQGLDEATTKTSSGLSTAAKTMGGFAKQVGQGDTSFKSLNSIVDIAANAMAGLAKSIPFAGDALSAGIKATAEASKFMLDQMDQTTKAFNDLGKTGALAADGMTGLQRQFTTSGLSLQVFTKQIGENSIALARFRGMTADGAEEFSKVTGALTQGTDDSLRKLGMSSEQIGESVGAFVTQQTRLGRAQGMTTNDLIEGSKKYAMELDGLAKVTGMSREAIMKQQDAALSESRFRASINSLNEQQQKDLLKLQTVMSNFGQELGQGTRDLVSGAANTDAARKLMADTGGAAADIIARLRDGTIDTTKAQVEMRDAIKRGQEAQEGVQKYTEGPFSNFANKADLVAAKFDETGTLVKKTQDAQINKTDKLTEQTVIAQKAMEGMNLEIQKLGFTFLPAASTAVAAMTKSMKSFVTYVNKLISGEGTDSGDSTGYDAGVSPEFGGTGTGMDMGGGAITAAAGTGPTRMNQADLKKIGLKIKEGDVQADNGAISPQLIALAKKIQAEVPGFAYFSGFNDNYHQEKAGDSKHTKGLALDFALSGAPSPEQGAKIAGMLRGMGASYVQDEYNNPSSKSTAGHFHAAVSAASGAVLTGPSGGYRPNLTMHGTEAIVPLNSPQGQELTGGGNSEMMSQQLDKMEEMVSILRSQLDVSKKLMQYSV
jgi:hypothetical protein